AEDDGLPDMHDGMIISDAGRLLLPWLAEHEDPDVSDQEYRSGGTKHSKRPAGDDIRDPVHIQNDAGKPDGYNGEHGEKYDKLPRDPCLHPWSEHVGERRKERGGHGRVARRKAWIPCHMVGGTNKVGKSELRPRAHEEFFERADE